MRSACGQAKPAYMSLGIKVLGLEFRAYRPYDQGVEHNLPKKLRGGFPILGVPSWGPYNRDYYFLGVYIMGSPDLRKLPYLATVPAA